VTASEKFSETDRRWWAFQPVADVAPPAPHAAWAAHNEVDHFLHTKLAEAGLTPSAEAPRSVVLRRLTLVLTGLPPSAEQQQAFAADQSSQAVEQLVDSLLASPRYGEHMARFWLDLVRYADSDGYKADEFRPHAWRYRDWVVRSFNQDLPYRDFMSQQIAGDELAPHNPDALIATGYLRHGIYEYNNRDAVGQRLTILNDITDTTSDVFLGLGLQCARCHDHKFDPLLQEDYYRLQAFFTPLNPEMATIVQTKAQAEYHQQKQTIWESKTEEIRREIDAILTPFYENATKEALSKFPPETQAIFAKPKESRSPFENQVAELTWRQVTYEHEKIEATIKGTDKKNLVKLRKRLAEFDSLKPPVPEWAHIIKESGPQAPPNLIPGGETKGDIAPGVPVLFSAAPLAVNPTENGTTGRTP
jgi:hypothetical protein